MRGEAIFQPGTKGVRWDIDIKEKGLTRNYLR